LKLVVVDQQALEPLRPMKPKKILIILLGLIAGGILGSAIVLGRSWVGSRSAVSVDHRKVAVPKGIQNK
ncbi:GNVR domain-containing protein, partial [Pantoea sp. SIMBA_072]